MMRIILLIACFLQIMMSQHKNKLTELKLSIDSIIASHVGTFAVSFKDIATGSRIDINELEYFHAASTMKTPVMIEVFNQVEQKIISLNDSIPVINSFKSIIDGTKYSLQLSEDSDDGLYDRIGKNESIRNLVYLMMTVSSNLSTNILMEKVGPDNVMKTLLKMGVKDIKVIRGVEDEKAFEAGENNMTTSFALSKIFESIAEKKCISKRSSEEMIDILLSQRFKDMIPAKLPVNIKVAHKTGSISKVQHDSGIIYLPDGRYYILVMLSKNLSSNKDGIDVLSTISKKIYDFMVE